jgi:hypothetical protein
VAERELRAGRVDAELHPQRPPLAVRGGHPLSQAVDGQDCGRAGGEDLVCVAQVRGHLAR